MRKAIVVLIALAGLVSVWWLHDRDVGETTTDDDVTFESESKLHHTTDDLIHVWLDPHNSSDDEDWEADPACHRAFKGTLDTAFLKPLLESSNAEHVAVAAMAMSNLEPREKLSYLEKAASMEPMNPMIQYDRLHLCHLIDGISADTCDYEAALADARKADPGNGAVLAHLAHRLFVRGGDKTAAEHAMIEAASAPYVNHFSIERLAVVQSMVTAAEVVDTGSMSELVLKIHDATNVLPQLPSPCLIDTLVSGRSTQSCRRYGELLLENFESPFQSMLGTKLQQFALSAEGNDIGANTLEAELAALRDRNLYVGKHWFYMWSSPELSTRYLEDMLANGHEHAFAQLDAAIANINADDPFHDPCVP